MEKIKKFIKRIIRERKETSKKLKAIKSNKKKLLKGLLERKKETSKRN